MSSQSVLVVGGFLLLAVALYFHPSLTLPLLFEWFNSQTTQTHCHRTEIMIVKIIELDRTGAPRQLILDWRKESDIY